MDQRLNLLVYDKEKNFDESDYVIMEIAKRGGDLKGGILSGYATSGRFRSGAWKEEFVTRDGTDYGEVEVSLDAKVAQVHSQLKSDEAVIVFDQKTET